MGLFNLLILAGLTAAVPLSERAAATPKSFLTQTGAQSWVLGNDIWNVTQGRQYATKLWYKGKDRVGRAVGHYTSYNGAQSDLNFTSGIIESSGSDWIDIKFTANEGDMHWVLYDDLPGAYQYFVNHALPTLGEFRTLWRLDNTSFPRGRTNVRDGVLPALAEYQAATNVQDETWQKADGTYLTKYDWSANNMELDFHGVYGDEVGSWYIHAGRDYFNGDHLKQELQVHRESVTGDAVQLNMIHGTHFQAKSSDTFADGRLWGPWLWYLNDGSVADAAARKKAEDTQWPYAWFADAAYRSRGHVSGKLVLSDGRPASGAAVFLGDNLSNLSTLDQGKGYYYRTYADSTGSFSIPAVRTGTYGLYAWGNGGNISDVTTRYVQNGVAVSSNHTTSLGKLSWKVTDLSKRIFQIGAFDRKTDGFGLSGPTLFEHARISKTPKNLTYTVGQSATTDWYFGQSQTGSWTVAFTIPSLPITNSTAKLTLSLAGFSQGSAADILVNGAKVGAISSALDNSQDTYRGATQAGEWRLLELPVTREQLKVGANTVNIKVTTESKWRGWLWDSVVFEWV